MKFLRRNESGVIFRLSKRDKDVFCDLLARFPMVPPSSLALSRFADPAEFGSDEEFLQETLAASKAEARKALDRLLNEGQHFSTAGNAYELKLSFAELGYLLQVFGDVRVGCWQALGCPDENKGKPLKLDIQNLEAHLAMEMTGRIQMLFLDVLSHREYDADIRLVERNQFLPVELKADTKFPSLKADLYEFGPSGMVAVGGDLSIKRLVKAYKSGIFPWTMKPITWWSPPQRGIIPLESFRVSESLRRFMRKKPFTVTANKAFREVITACATARAEKTWISPEFIDGYTALHETGQAHSVECWEAGKLVGGVYGVAVGGLFAAESMFYLKSNASKVALVHLVQTLKMSGFTLLDIQMVTPTTAAFGAVEISREDYLQRLKEAVRSDVRFQFAGEE